MLPLVSHTLNIFARLTRDLPPLVPEPVQRDIRDSYTRLARATNLSVIDAETVIILESKKIWPYRRAFRELTELYEEKIGEHFFLAHLTDPLKERYRSFTASGGGFRAVWSGKSASFFFGDDRPSLLSALINTWQQIQNHAAQAALSVAQRRYNLRIAALSNELEVYEKELVQLRLLTATQAGYLPLAAEIQAYIQACEYGFCGLGPAVPLAAVHQAREHFQGRKAEKRMLPSSLGRLDLNHVL